MPQPKMREVANSRSVLEDEYMGNIPKKGGIAKKIKRGMGKMAGSSLGSGVKSSWGRPALTRKIRSV